MAEVVESLPSNPEALGSIPSRGGVLMGRLGCSSVNLSYAFCLSITEDPRMGNSGLPSAWGTRAS
jgi:hypothetical protein